MLVYTLERSEDLFPRLYITLRESDKSFSVKEMFEYLDGKNKLEEKKVVRIIPLRNNYIELKIYYSNGLEEFFKFDYDSGFHTWRCLDRKYENIENTKYLTDMDMTYLKSMRPLNRTLKKFHLYPFHSHPYKFSYRYNKNEEWITEELNPIRKENKKDV